MENGKDVWNGRLITIQCYEGHFSNPIGEFCSVQLDSFPLRVIKDPDCTWQIKIKYSLFFVLIEIEK